MALVKCPECGNSISDKAEKCPHCGVPATYFFKQNATCKSVIDSVDYKELPNILISFDSDYVKLFSAEHYITHRETVSLHETYDSYYSSLKNKLIFQYICNNASTFRVDIDSLKQFLRRMHTLEENIVTHNNEYIEQTLEREKEYFDNILIDMEVYYGKFNKY